LAATGSLGLIYLLFYSPGWKGWMLGWNWAATLFAPILPVIAAPVGDFGRIT